MVIALAYAVKRIDRILVVDVESKRPAPNALDFLTYCAEEPFHGQCPFGYVVDRTNSENIPRQPIVSRGESLVKPLVKSLTGLGLARRADPGRPDEALRRTM